MLRDKQLLAYHSAVFDKVKQYPELLEQAKQNLARLLDCQHLGKRLNTIRRWQWLLELPLDKLEIAVLEQSHSGRTLREHTIFSGILTESERQQAML